MIDGVAIDVNPDIYTMGIPVMAAGHDKATCAVKLVEFTDDIEAIKAAVKSFVFDTCKAEANWNMTNFEMCIRERVYIPNGNYSGFRIIPVTF